MTSYQELQGFAKAHLKAAHIIQSDAEALENCNPAQSKV